MKRWYEGLRRGDHAAHIYRSEAEQVRVVTDTLSWMDDDQRLILLSDRWEAEERVSRSRVLEAAMDDGHLVVVPARSTLCPTGHFSARAFEGLLSSETESMIDEGSEPVLMWDLDWLAGDDAAFEAHIVQQSSMALSSSERRATLIGQYGTAFFSTEQLDRVVRVTPLVLEGGLLTRKFWVVSKNSVGKPSKDGNILRMNIPLDSSGENQHS
jgi:hypothetical protein